METDITRHYEELIEDRTNEFFYMVRELLSEEDKHRVEYAFRFAKAAHGDQKRKTGEPYILHPIAVARIVAVELELGANPIIAAFLHDVVEDTHYTIEDIRERFGDDVAFLVGVVTKQKKEQYEVSKQVDNFKQMLDSVHYDIRALLLKLADRLHNMRTLSSMRPDKQMKIAGETDYFYAPLANRLGLHKIKTELENLSFRFRCPREYAALESALRKERIEREKYINGFMENITRLLASRGINVRTQLRYRAPYKVWRKMYTSGCDFHHIDDKYYVRIIYGENPGMSEKDICLKIYSVLTDVYKERPHSVNNYIDSPKENGYQSFHLKLLSDKGIWEEIHISSENMVRRSQFGCIADRSEGNIGNWIEKFKSVLQDVACHGKEVEYMEGVTMSFYNDDIMVYTPHGMYVILPKNATALDFAFEIHSNIGKHAQYAKINGRLCSVKTVLQRGDCVEIGTNDNIEPRPDWLDHVVTYKAKRHLRTMLNRQRKISYIRCPNCRPLPGDEVIGFKDKFDKITLHRRDCKSAIRQASHNGDAIVAVNFEEDGEFIYPACINIFAIDRYHLLIDLIDCITNKLKLSIISLTSTCEDEIVNCTIEFHVHSSRELHEVIEHISAIEGVDEVKQKFVER